MASVSQWPPAAPTDLQTSVADHESRLDAIEGAASKVSFLNRVMRPSGSQTLTVKAVTFEVLWSYRFIIDGMGRASYFTLGYYDIDCPGTGVVIPGVAGAPGTTANAYGVPLQEWEALYYILPLGGAPDTVLANFRIVGDSTNFEVPDHWVRIAFRNGDNGNAMGSPYYDEVIWCNGITMTPWVSINLTSPWTHYSAPYGPAAFRVQNGHLECRGLIVGGSGAGGTGLFNIPDGWRPVAANPIFLNATAGSGVAPLTVTGTTGGVPGQVYINDAATGTPGTWLSIANIRYSIHG